MGEQKEESVESVINDVSKWSQKRKSVYYDYDLDTSGHIASMSAKEILNGFNLEV